MIADHLADGRLNLTTLVELRDVLDEPRLDEVLRRAAGRTEEQVKELVAALAPRPAPDDLLRRLPAPKTSSSGPELQPAIEPGGSEPQDPGRKPGRSLLRRGQGRGLAAR